MANSLGTLSGALVLQRALTLTFTQRPMLSMISKGFREIDGAVDNALLGQSVKTRIKSVQSVQAFGTGAQDVSDTDVTVSLTDHKEVHVAFGPAEYNATNRDLIDEVAQPIAVAIANHIVDSVAALWTSSNFSNNITPTEFSYTELMVKLRKKMGLAGIPMENRFLVVNSDVYGDLLSDPIIVAALNNPLNANAIAEGKLPAVSGIQIAEYPSLDALSTTKRVGFAGHPESTIYVSRAPKGPGEVAGSLNFPGVIDYIEDPTTGFRVQVTQWVDPATLVVNNRLSWLQGYAKGNSAQGILIKTT
jgi:hypothetical protein